MRRWSIFFIIVLMLLTAAGAFGCPLCKDSIPAGDTQSYASVPSGFNNTIYLMLGSLFCMIGFVAFTVVKGARTSVHARAVQNSEES
jgi:hypothetical protein